MLPVACSASVAMVKVQRRSSVARLPAASATPAARRAVYVCARLEEDAVGEEAQGAVADLVHRGGDRRAGASVSVKLRASTPLTGSENAP